MKSIEKERGGWIHVCPQMTERLKHRLQLAVFKVCHGWEAYSLPQVNGFVAQLEYRQIQTRREMILRKTEETYKRRLDETEEAVTASSRQTRAVNSVCSSLVHSRRPSRDASCVTSCGLGWLLDEEDGVLGENKIDCLVGLPTFGGCEELWAPYLLEQGAGVAEFAKSAELPNADESDLFCSDDHFSQDELSLLVHDDAFLPPHLQLMEEEPRPSFQRLSTKPRRKHKRHWRRKSAQSLLSSAFHA